jgi:hypothetical protein
VQCSEVQQSFSDYKWKDLRVFDPLAGGGTTLFTALYLGRDCGVEKNANDVQSTVTFLKQYTKEQKIACSLKEEGLKNQTRILVAIGAEEKCLIINGDTAESPPYCGIKRPILLLLTSPTEYSTADI